MNRASAYLLAAMVVLLTSLYVSPAAFARTIEVTTELDAVAEDGECSLREAVIAANTNSPSDTCPAGEATGKDVIQLPAGTYTLTLGPAGDDAAATGDLDITEDAVISGAGSKNTIVQVDSISFPGLADRAIHVLAADVDIRRITIRNGMGDEGGAVSVTGGSVVSLTSSTLRSNQAGTGGAIFVDGTSALTARRATLKSNQASGPSGAVEAGGDVTFVDSTLQGNDSGYFGGAIHSPHSSDPHVTLRRSLVHDNEAAAGGGLFLEGGGGSELTIENSTISGNRAVRFNECCTPYAGAIYHNDKTTITSSTIAGNTAEDIAGIQVDTYATSDADIQDSIIANNFESVKPYAATNCDGGGGIESLGGNVEYPGSTCPTIESDQQADPLFGPLEDNGGPTLTHALAAGSPAIGAAVDCLATDQRGALRSGPCDSGAYERVVCAGTVVDRVGTAGNDSLKGDDTENGFLGMAGNDKLTGNGGGDAACGGSGSDKAAGGDGNDFLKGQGDADVLKGGDGKDLLVGGPGDDVLAGGPGNDTCKGGPGKDVLEDC